MQMRFQLLLLVLLAGSIWRCTSSGDNHRGAVEKRDFRQDMRQLIQTISAYAKQTNPDFIIIPQNGHGLLTLGDDTTAGPASAYLAAIDGVGREDLFFGYNADNQATPASERDEMLGFMDLAEAHRVRVLATDYCSTPAKMDSSYAWNHRHGFISFAADQRELNNIPNYPSEPYHLNGTEILNLPTAQNFLYILNPGNFTDKAGFLNALDATGYDLIITDAFFGASEPLSAAEVTALRTKPGGARRLVIAYMSIGEAESYRPYWQSGWQVGNPAWLFDENPDWPGNYKVAYWDPEWQTVLFGGSTAYLDRITAAGFDGVYLDIIDAYEYFENL